MLRHRLPGALLALTLVGRTAAAWQEPKLGADWYEDKVDLGFKVRSPKDWQFVPASPLEPNMIGRYAASNGQYVNLGGEAFVLVTLYLVKFDRRSSAAEPEQLAAEGESVDPSSSAATDVESWMTSGIDEGSRWHRVAAPVDLKGSSIKAKTSIYEGLSARGRTEAEPKPVRAHVTEFELAPDLFVALVGLGPGEKKWRPYEKAYEAIAKTLQRIEVPLEPRRADAGLDPRALKQKKLEAEVARSPGWSLYETPNYFILSSYDDKQFIEELKTRLEGIRAVYERDYPPARARRLQLAPETPDVGVAPGGVPSSERTSITVDPLELARTSVVRVCKDRDQYLRYGGPLNTGGYFRSVEEELVIFDDKQERGREFTWGVLSHEAFHQYIFAFYGNVAPHSWYNEGTGDYYYGFEYRNGKFKQGPARNRQDTLVSLIGEDRHAPLRDFVRWPKSWYYAVGKPGNPGNGKGGGALSQPECYAQGWSLIWFLRTGAGKAKGWQESWGSILDKYLETLLETGELDQAVDKAFEGVDWDLFEASWLAYTR